MEFPMTSQDANDIQFSRVHSSAIYTEVAERLLTGNPGRLPPRLLQLTKQLDGIERGGAAIRNQIEVGPR
jgi:hypothetical protein